MSVPAIVDTHEEAAGLDLPPLLIRRPLEAFLDGLGLGAGPVEAETLGDGHSNITYRITRDGASWVLRRPPRPPLPPSAHDVLREARLLLGVENADVRTPTVLATCDDESVIGAPFYVMEEMTGDVINAEIPSPLDTVEQRRTIANELVDALAEVHAADWRECGLEGYGKPSGYLSRQLRRFNGLWAHNKTREVPMIEQVEAWLAEHMPESGPATIVHGDYRLGNTMFAHGAPARLNAIFDWELSTIGDPLADVGYLTATYAQPGDEEYTVGTLSPVTRWEGFPTRDELIVRYEERSGRSMANVRWYQTLALWKSAVFLEGSYGRLLQGTTDDPFFKLLEQGVPQLADRAWEISQGRES